eukprot:PhF_6_TR31193/c0_g1_i1/m.45748
MFGFSLRRFYIAQSALTGLPFKDELQRVLTSEASSRGYVSSYWITPKQLRIFDRSPFSGVSVVSSVSVSVMCDGVPLEFICLDELEETNKVAMEAWRSKHSYLQYCHISEEEKKKRSSTMQQRQQEKFSLDYYEPISMFSGCPIVKKRLSSKMKNFANTQGYLSPYWTTRRHLAKFPDVVIKPGMVGVVDELSFQIYNTITEWEGAPPSEPVGPNEPSEDNEWFNVEQTTGEDLLISHVLSILKIVARSGKTGKPFAEECQAVLQATSRQRSYVSNYWLTEGQLQSFEQPIVLKPGEVGILLRLRDVRTRQDRDVLVYNLDQTENGLAVLEEFGCRNWIHS